MNSNIGKTQWEIGWLYQQRQQREAQRQRRGRGYALAEVLLWVALSKLCGADETHGVAAWVQLRQEAVRRALDGQRDPFPHAVRMAKADAAVLKQAQRADHSGWRWMRWQAG